MLNKILTITLCAMICLCAYTYNEIKQTEDSMANQIYQLELLRSDIKNNIEYLDVVYNTAEKYNLPPELALAMMKVESNFDVSAENGSCQGLMQVNSLYHTANLLDLRENVECSFSLLSSLIDESNTLEEALGKYNRGKAGYAQYVQEHQRLTTAYSQKVIYTMNLLQNVN